MGAFNLRVSEKGIPVAVGSFAHLRSGKVVCAGFVASVSKASTAHVGAIAGVSVCMCQCV